MSDIAVSQVSADALERDGRKCRNPRCTFRTHGLEVVACPAFRADRRDSTDWIISLCSGCRDLLERGLLSIEPQTPEWCDAEVAFYGRNRAGRLVCLATEIRIGVISTRGHR